MIIATWKFFVTNFQQSDEALKIQEMQSIRISLGSYILFGLEVLIAADIIETIARPDFKEIAILMGIVVIRISTSFFLSKEIEDAKRIAEEEKK